MPQRAAVAVRKKKAKNPAWELKKRRLGWNKRPGDGAPSASPAKPAKRVSVPEAAKPTKKKRSRPDDDEEIEEVEEEKQQQTKKKKKRGGGGPKKKRAKRETPEEREARHADEMRRTLFLRNLPLSATEADVAALLSARAGDGDGGDNAVQYCRLVTDRESGTPKGTGFVCFAARAAAERVLDEAYPDYWTAAQTPASRARGESCVALGGRQISLAWALAHDEAERISAQTQGERRKLEKPTDKRNTAIAFIGYMKKEDMEAAGFNDVEVRRRLDAYHEKAALLKNPNNVVSQTRLSVRFLPLDVDEAMLRQAAREAVLRKTGKAVRVRQSKIVRDKVRVDATTGKLRSRGFGFLEFFTHEDALAALEALNNNREAFGAGTGARPLVDFAVDNAFAIAKLKRSVEKGAQAAEQKLKAAAAAAEERPKLAIPKWKLDPAKRRQHEAMLQAQAEKKKKKRSSSTKK